MKHWKFIQSAMFIIGICPFLAGVLLMSQTGPTSLSPSEAEELGKYYADKYMAIPGFVEKQNFYYMGFLQGRTLYTALEFPEQQLQDFLSTTCYGGNIDQLSKNNPFENNAGVLGELPDWWSPVEDDFYRAGKCSVVGQTGSLIKVNIMSAYIFSISKKQNSVVIYLKFDW